MTRRYRVKEIFYSVQGEGVRAGIPHVFVRFAGCNLSCNVAQHGFDCDTDFAGGDRYSLKELVAAIVEAAPHCGWVLLTGGEPALQVDAPLVAALRDAGMSLAMETNGTRPLPPGIDWVCASPKPGAPVVLAYADELKFVLGPGQEPRATTMVSLHRLVSPAFKGDEADVDAMATCVAWVLEHPDWRLSVQTHKWLGVR